jgi:serine/threonine-protein kinase
LVRHSGDSDQLTTPLARLGRAARRFAIVSGLAAALWASFLAVTVRPIVALLSVVPVVIAALLSHAMSRVLSGVGAQVSSATEMGMYQLEERIGVGGMGEVWRARHRLLSRPAAVKLIRERPDASSATPTPGGTVAERRFEREANVTASLKSPHTVELYDYGMTDSGTIYYVMELLEGNTLEELVKREGPLEPARVVHILSQVLDSLAEAHARGLVHRDIKPANLHLSQRGLEPDFVKVLDFGLVKSRYLDQTDVKLTAANDVVGTPAYAAPEVITAENAVDGRADLYSLGCVAYFLLTAAPVFEADSALSMAIAHAVQTPEPPSTRLGRPLPSDLENIVLACLAKTPEQRPQSAVELLELLRRVELPDPEASASRELAPLRRERAEVSNAVN